MSQNCAHRASVIIIPPCPSQGKTHTPLWVTLRHKAIPLDQRRHVHRPPNAVSRLGSCIYVEARLPRTLRRSGGAR